MATWLAIRRPVSGLRGLLLKVLALLIPLGLWCLISYCPYVWHPLLEVTEPGDSGLDVGVTCTPSILTNDINKPLREKGLRPAIGVPANPPILPAPHRVVLALYTVFVTPPPSRNDQWFHSYIGESLYTIFVGFSLAMILAIPIGIMCGTFDVIAKLIEPFTDFVRYMPPPSFGPLMMGVWGLLAAPKIAIIFIGCFFNMVLVAANTTRSLDVSLLEAAQTLGARRAGLVAHVIIPGVLPGIYKDIRICLGAAWTFLTAAELVGSWSGITGGFLNQEYKHNHWANVYAGLIVIGMLGFLTDQTLAFIGTLIFPWTPEANHKARRWFRFLGFITRPVDGSHPAPLSPEELARFTKPRRSLVPYSTEGVATPHVVAQTTEVDSAGKEISHADR